MITDEKVLLTGPAGSIAFALGRSLAEHNEVWGIARFGDPAQRAEVDALGITTRAIDLLDCNLEELPDDFTYVLHLAVNYEKESYDRAIQVNAEATGLLLEHCRKAKAALIMSTNGVYKPHPDPWHAFCETDPLGDMLAHPSPAYSVSKIGQESVARYCARSFDLPVTIARMNTAYGPRGGLPVGQLHAAASGQPVRTRFEPCPYSPIHEDDIVDQVEALLDAASVPATVVNWAGDEAVSVQEWAAYYGELLGREVEVAVQEIPGASRGNVADNTRRMSFTGPCKVSWRDGFRRTAACFYPDHVKDDAG